jgi:hypothetical protein
VAGLGVAVGVAAARAGAVAPEDGARGAAQAASKTNTAHAGRHPWASIFN